MSTVTIYLCGTGKHRDQTDYLIGRLYALDAAPAWQPANDATGGQHGRKLVLDGPGSSRPIQATKDVVEGTVAPHAVGDRGRITGLASGTGWADNTHFAMQWLLAVDAEARKLGGAGAPVDCVNMVGHSRGAVTATMIAHLIRHFVESRIHIELGAEVGRIGWEHDVKGKKAYIELNDRRQEFDG